MNGIWSARIAQTVIVLAIAIGWRFGAAVLMLIGCCLGIASVVRDFAKQCEKPWFAVLFGLVRGQLAVGSGERPRFNANQGHVSATQPS
jgi:uncharacterized membrane protein YedE/YeeE